MKKIKRRQNIKVSERLVRHEDAEKCPKCGLPFPASIQFADKRIFHCFICEKNFEQYEDGFKEITDECQPEKGERSGERARMRAGA